MLKKRSIVVFLLLVFLIPVMPVMQVGLLLSQGQLTEELAGDAPVDHGSKISGSEHPYYLSTHVQFCGNFSSYLKVEKDEYVPSRQADDIKTPPPNLKGSLRLFL